MKYNLGEVERGALNYIIKSLGANWESNFIPNSVVSRFTFEQYGRDGMKYDIDCTRILIDFLRANNLAENIEGYHSNFRLKAPKGRDLFRCKTIEAYEMELTQTEELNAQIKQQYTERISDESLIRKNQIALTNYQLKNEALQEALHPLIKQANETTIHTNKQTQRNNKVLVFLFSITAIFATICAVTSIMTMNAAQTRASEGKSVKEVEAKLAEQNAIIVAKSDSIQHQLEEIAALKKRVDTAQVVK